VDPASTFYQTLSGSSFTLLGLWLTVMQLGHGGWRKDATRHRATLHIALHFFLTAVLGLFATLSGSSVLVWRVTFALGGLVGLVEALDYLRRRAIPHGRAHYALSVLDPLLYLAVIVTAFLPPGVLGLTPLQAEGIVTGLLFVSGLCSAWIAFAERAPAEADAVG
jgi:hypothetical protein